MTEAQLQREVVRLLQLKGFHVWETYTGSARGGVVYMHKGLPDLYAFKGTPEGPLALWLELKTPTGRLSPEQAQAHLELRGAGLLVYVPRSLDDVLEILVRHGQHRAPFGSDDEPSLD